MGAVLTKMGAVLAGDVLTGHPEKTPPPSSQLETIKVFGRVHQNAAPRQSLLSTIDLFSSCKLSTMTFDLRT